jgi:hypothetical protein
MTRIKTILVTTCAALTLAAGLAFGQGGLMPYPRPDLEVIAAQDALEEAMVHLDKARIPSAAAITRAKAFIALAHTELLPAGGVQGLQRTPE